MSSDRGTRSAKKVAGNSEFSDAISLAVDQIVNSQSFLSKLSAMIVDAVSEKFSETFKTYDDRFRSLTLENLSLKSELKNLSSRIEHYEVSYRRNRLIFFRVPEVEGTLLTNHMIQLINSKIGMSINESNIASCYRIGKTSSDKPRPVLIDIKSRDVKMQIFKAKKQLKSTGVSVQEDLPPSRRALYQTACDKMGYRNVWTSDCVVFAKHNRGLRKFVNMEQFLTFYTSIEQLAEESHSTT